MASQEENCYEASVNPEFGSTLVRRLNQSCFPAVLQSNRITIKFGTGRSTTSERPCEIVVAWDDRTTANMDPCRLEIYSVITSTSSKAIITKPSPLYYSAAAG